jgi:hypothetical protein
MRGAWMSEGGRSKPTATDDEGRGRTKTDQTLPGAAAKT